MSARHSATTSTLVFIALCLLPLVKCNLLRAQYSVSHFSQSNSVEELKNEIERRRQERKVRSHNPKGIVYMRADIALSKYQAGKLFILDVNPRGVYEQYHVWGAVLATNIHQSKSIKLPQNIEIALYCQ